MALLKLEAQSSNQKPCIPVMLDSVSMEMLVGCVRIIRNGAEVLLSVVSAFINTLKWIGVNLSVYLCVMDVTSFPQRILWERDYKVYYNAYSGNESPNLQRPTWSSLSRHSHSYRRATKAGQTTLRQAKTLLSTSRILS